MDEVIFSKIVKELLLLKGKVILPGFGTFISEIAPAFFSNDGLTIYPPSRRIFFRNLRVASNDETFYSFYASKQGLRESEAKEQVSLYLEKIQAKLYSKKNIELPGLGKLRTTREGDLFFVMDRNLDCYIEEFSLTPVNLKIKQSSDPRREVVEEVKVLHKQPEMPEKEEEFLEPESKEDAKNIEETSTEAYETSAETCKKRLIIKRVFTILLLLALIFFIVIIIAVIYNPEALDYLLYNSEDFDYVNPIKEF